MVPSPHHHRTITAPSLHPRQGIEAVAMQQALAEAVAEADAISSSHEAMVQVAATEQSVAFVPVSLVHKHVQLARALQESLLQQHQTIATMAQDQHSLRRALSAKASPLSCPSFPSHSSPAFNPHSLNPSLAFPISRTFPSFPHFFLFVCVWRQ